MAVVLEKDAGLIDGAAKAIGSFFGKGQKALGSVKSTFSEAKNIPGTFSNFASTQYGKAKNYFNNTIKPAYTKGLDNARGYTTTVPNALKPWAGEAARLDRTLAVNGIKSGQVNITGMRPGKSQSISTGAKPQITPEMQEAMRGSFVPAGTQPTASAGNAFRNFVSNHPVGAATATGIGGLGAGYLLFGGSSAPQPMYPQQFQGSWQ